MPEARRFWLTRQKMLGFLDELERNSEVTDGSYYLTAGLSRTEVAAVLKEASESCDMPNGLVEVAADSPTGSVLYCRPERTYLILPPFPIAATAVARGLSTPPLRSLLNGDFSIALLLVRLGAYAVGICRGEQLVGSKVGTGLVHGRHKKGGSSQQRFRRHREKQIEYFFNRVCHHAREYLEPQAGTLDYMVYGGARMTLLSLQKQCPFLSRFADRTLPPLLDIPEPRRPVLETAVNRVWSSQVVEWHPPSGAAEL